MTRQHKKQQQKKQQKQTLKISTSWSTLKKGMNLTKKACNETTNEINFHSNLLYECNAHFFEVCTYDCICL